MISRKIRLPLQICNFWDIQGDISNCLNMVTKAKYYDILTMEFNYKLEQKINNIWVDSDMIFNRSDR